MWHRASRIEVPYLVFLCRFAWSERHVVFQIDSLGDIVGRKDDDFAVGEEFFVVRDDRGRVFGDVDGWFVFGYFSVYWSRFCCVFNGLRLRLGDTGVRKISVEEFQAALEAGDAVFELIDLAVEEADGAVVGVEVGGGADHGVHFEEFGREGGGNLGVVDEGEIPVHGDAGVEARDFPAGDGDAFDDVAGGFVDGLVNSKEAFDEAGVFLAFLIAEDGGVRRDEEFEFGGVFAGFDGVAAGRGFALVSGGSMGFGAVFAGDTGSIFS